MSPCPLTHTYVAQFPRVLDVFQFFRRVYDLEYRKIVQKNVGHTDSVRSIIHLPERQQVNHINIAIVTNQSSRKLMTAN